MIFHFSFQSLSLSTQKRLVFGVGNWCGKKKLHDCPMCLTWDPCLLAQDQPDGLFSIMWDLWRSSLPQVVNRSELWFFCGINLATWGVDWICSADFFCGVFEKRGMVGAVFFLKWDDHLNGIINGFSWGYFNLYTYRGYNPIPTGRAGRGPPCRYAGGTFMGESDLCRQCRW